MQKTKKKIKKYHSYTGIFIIFEIFWCISKFSNFWIAIPEYTENYKIACIISEIFGIFCSIKRNYIFFKFSICTHIS